MRVIVVEDNPLLRQLETEILSKLGYKVAATARAEEALQLLGAESAAMLIIDVQLPEGMDGIALARAARQRRSDLAVMVVSADADNVALEGIADEVLIKPFQIDEFEQRVVALARIAETLAAARRTSSDDLRAGTTAANERVVGDQKTRIRAWRRRAEELRTTADNFVVPSAQESLRRAAANYDQRANHVEAMLEGRPPAPEEETG
jgi:DNA-binding response OmpR family regulator